MRLMWPNVVLEQYTPLRYSFPTPLYVGIVVITLDKLIHLCLYRGERQAYVKMGEDGQRI